MSHPHCKPTPPVKGVDVRTDIWTRMGWTLNVEEEPNLESLEAYEGDGKWQTRASAYMAKAGFGNPITAWMAGQYPSNAERNKELCRHFEEVESGCKRVMLSRTQPIKDADFYKAGSHASADHTGNRIVEEVAPRKGSIDAVVSEYEGATRR